MTIEWNPGAPEIEGNEHPAIGHYNAKSDTYQDQWAVTFKARQTAPLTHVRLFIAPNSGTTQLPYPSVWRNQRAPVMVELFNEGSEATDEPINETFPVSFVGSFSAGQMTNYSFASPTAADIDTLNDGLGIRAFSQFAFLDLQFPTDTYPLNRRIIRSGLEVWTNGGYYVERHDPDHSWDCIVQAFSPNTGQPWAFYHGEAILDVLPSITWKWTTPQNIRDYRQAGPNFYRVACWQNPGLWAADLIRMHVVSVTENRLGVGLASYGPSDFGRWVEIPIATPAGTGNPTLTNGNRYSLIVRRSGGDSHYTAVQFASAPFRVLRGMPLETDDYLLRPVIQKVPQPSSPGDFENWYWLNGTIDTEGLGPQVEGVMGLRLVNSGTYRPETQPYDRSMGAVVWNGAKDVIPTTSAPASGHSLFQKWVIVGTTEVYGQVSMLVGYNPANPAPTGPIRVEVRNSVGALVLGPSEMSFAEWDSLPYNVPYSDTDEQGNRYKRVRIRFDTGVNVPDGEYGITVTSPGTPESAAWRVGVLATRSGPGNVHSTSFGGDSHWASGYAKNVPPTIRPDHPEEIYTAIDGTSGGTSSGIFADAQIMLATVPAAPANVSAEVSLLTAHHMTSGDCAGSSDPDCGEETVPGIRVSWDDNGDAESVAFQVHRKDHLEADWQLVALTGPDETEWIDYEPRIGVLTCYRVRGARPDGINGDWSAEVCATVPSGRTALCFTSNWATGMAVTLPEAWETRGSIERTWDYAETGDVERRLIYGSDGQMSLHPIERRGVRFNRVLLLNALATVSTPTTEIARPLRDLSWVQIPYVCVRDGEGNRWFASITVPGISNKRRGERWFAELSVVEATGKVAVVDTREPQVTKVEALA